MMAQTNIICIRQPAQTGIKTTQPNPDFQDRAAGKNPATGDSTVPVYYVPQKGNCQDSFSENSIKAGSWVLRGKVISRPCIPLKMLLLLNSVKHSRKEISRQAFFEFSCPGVCLQQPGRAQAQRGRQDENRRINIFILQAEKGE